MRKIARKKRISQEPVCIINKQKLKFEPYKPYKLQKAQLLMDENNFNAVSVLKGGRNCFCGGEDYYHGVVS